MYLSVKVISKARQLGPILTQHPPSSVWKSRHRPTPRGNLRPDRYNCPMQQILEAQVRLTHLLVPSSHFPTYSHEKWHSWPTTTCFARPLALPLCFTGWPKTSCYHGSESMRNRPDQADVRLSGPSRTTTKTPSAARPHSATSGLLGSSFKSGTNIDIVSHDISPFFVQKTCRFCIAKHLLLLPSSYHSLWEN